MWHKIGLWKFRGVYGCACRSCSYCGFCSLQIVTRKTHTSSTNADLMDPHVPGVNPETKTGDPSGFELASNNANIPPDPSPKGDQDPPLIQSHEFEFSSPSSPPLSSAAQFDNIDSSND